MENAIEKKLVQVSETEVHIDFKLNKKCRSKLEMKSLLTTTTCFFKVQTSSPNKFLVNPPTGLIPPSSTTTLEIILKPQSEPPPSFPRSISDRFLIKITPFQSDQEDYDYNDERFKSSLSPAQHVKLKVAYVGQFLLRHAVMLRDVDAVKNIIKRQNSVLTELSLDDAEFLFWLASESATDDSGAMMNLLLKAGLNVVAPRDAYNGGGDGDDVVAAERSRWESKGWSELHVAAFLDRKDEVLEILGGGVVGFEPLLELRDKEGRTALHLATCTGSFGCAKVLVESGADVNAKCAKDGWTPLHRAVANSDRRMVEMLIDAGADSTVPDDCGLTPIDISHDKGCEIKELLERGESVLVAARCGELQQLKSLLEKGASTKYCDQYGLTALHAAAIKGHTEILEMLVKFGAELEIKDREGHTPLHLAVEGGNLDTVEVLVTHGADINAKTERGATPLYLAKAIGFEDIVWFLLNKGATTSP